MRISALAASLLLSSVALPAAAADFPIPTIDPAPMVFSWTGFYAGVQGGYLWGDGDIAEFGNYADPSPTGLTAGLYAGANYQLENNIVLGIDADIAWGGANDSVPLFNSSGVPYPAVHLVQDVALTGAIRGRVGYAIDRFLPYATLGFAFGDIQQRLVETSTSTVEHLWDANYAGYTVGVGVEYAVTDNLIARADYSFTDFGSATIIDTESTVETTLTTNTLRLGLAYKF